MRRWKRRVIGYFGLLAGALVLTALGYQWGMGVYEGRPRTFIDSLQFVVEMFTTTGFGGDAPWHSSQMQLYILVTDLLGMALLVGALPVVASPLLERILSTTAPRKLEESLTDHVVICSFTSRAESLVEELESQDVPYVIVESDREVATELYEDELPVIRADPKSTEGLETARLGSARALFADSTDQVDASIVLAAKELAEDVPILSVVEDPDRARYHRLAGADHVLSPRPLLGRSLAQKVTTSVRSEIDESIEIGEQLQLAEVSIRRGSRLAGRNLGQSGIRERAGVNVIGAWLQGQFDASPTPETSLQAGTVLLVSGRSDQLDRLVKMTQSSVRRFGTGKTVVVGCGRVGQAVTAELDDANIPHTVVDQSERKEVDISGDATEPETLEAAGIKEAQTVLLALPDDTATEFATLVVRDLAPETEIIARINEEDNVSKTYRAGADYVLALATVTGRMAASHLLEDRDVLSLDQQVEVVRTQAEGMVGYSLGQMNIREKTGCTVIAIERDEDVMTDIGPDTQVQREDELVIVGTDEGVRTFEQLFK